MNNKLPEEVNAILEEIKSTQMDFDLDVDTIIRLMYFKLKSMNVSAAAMDHFALTLKEDKNKYVEALGGAILSEIINDALKTMLKVESIEIDNKKD